MAVHRPEEKLKQWLLLQLGVHIAMRKSDLIVSSHLRFFCLLGFFLSLLSVVFSIPLVGFGGGMLLLSAC